MEYENFYFWILSYYFATYERPLCKDDKNANKKEVLSVGYHGNDTQSSKKCEIWANFELYLLLNYTTYIHFDYRFENYIQLPKKWREGFVNFGFFHFFHDFSKFLSEKWPKIAKNQTLKIDKKFKNQNFQKSSRHFLDNTS